MGGAKQKKNLRVYAVSFIEQAGDDLLFIFEAKNVEHLHKLFRAKFEEGTDLSGNGALVAVLGGSDRINSEATKQLNKLLEVTK